MLALLLYESLTGASVFACFELNAGSSLRIRKPAAATEGSTWTKVLSTDPAKSFSHLLLRADHPHGFGCLD